MNLHELTLYAPETARLTFETAKQQLLHGQYHDAAATLEAAAADAKLPYQRDAKKIAKEIRAKAITTRAYVR